MAGGGQAGASADGLGLIHAGRGDDGDDRGVQPGRLVLGHPLPAAGGRAVHDQLVDQVVIDRRERGLAVACRPGLPHHPDLGPRPSQSWNAAYAGTVR